MSPRIAIIGGGLGGSTAGISLQRAGFDVQVYEQAGEIQRVGAGIQLQANTMRVLAALDLDKPIRNVGVPISRWQSRVWDTGEIIFEPKGLSDWVVVHRADLLDALLRALKPGTFHSRKRLEGLDKENGCVKLTFADGSAAEADIVIGADGINSRVRELLLGPESPRCVRASTTIGKKSSGSRCCLRSLSACCLGASRKSCCARSSSLSLSSKRPISTRVRLAVCKPKRCSVAWSG